MKKQIVLTIVGLIVLVGALVGIKGLQIGDMLAQGKTYVPPPEVVTSTAVKQDSNGEKV